MRPRSLLLSFCTVGALVAGVYGASNAGPPPDPRPAATATATDGALPADAPVRAPRVDSDVAGRSACSAPSVAELHAPDDARDLGALAACSPDDPWAHLADREQAAALHCDAAARRIDLSRVLEGALPLDAATTDHVRAVFRAGQAQGRRPDAFGLIGDSMTLDANFLRPFAAVAALPRDVEASLTLAAPKGGARTVLELFRGGHDSFIAPRAAKVGARAPWALAPRGGKEGLASPLDAMVAGLSPAYAAILYGANDALWRTDSLELLVRGFRAALASIVDALELRGIVPILTTVPKHMREKGWPDCPSAALAASNERFAVQATALSAEVADLACQRHLPLVDLRWALDPLLDHGVGPDGVHLSVHPGGGGVLDAGGLECGYNVRNLVTLRELARVVDAVSW